MLFCKGCQGSAEQVRNVILIHELSLQLPWKRNNHQYNSVSLPPHITQKTSVYLVFNYLGHQLQRYYTLGCLQKLKMLAYQVLCPHIWFCWEYRYRHLLRNKIHNDSDQSKAKMITGFHRQPKKKKLERQRKRQCIKITALLCYSSWNDRGQLATAEDGFRFLTPPSWPSVCLIAAKMDRSRPSLRRG